jgi:hypothetical protein
VVCEIKIYNTPLGSKLIEPGGPEMEMKTAEQSTN